MFITVNGARLACYERGRSHATVLLLVHGFPLDHRLWAAQLRGLAYDAHVVAPDLRGHGRSAVLPGPVTMDQHADDLAALLDVLALPRAVVAGLSMGGYVAMAFWRRHPQRVQALVLVDTRAEPDGPAARAARDAAAERVQAIGAAAYGEEMLPKLMAAASLAERCKVAAVRRMMAEQPVAGILGALSGLRDRPDSRPTLPTITVPALVLVGEADALTPPADAAALAAAIPGAHMVAIPRAGHLSPLENPRAVNSALRAFLRDLGTG